MSATLLFGRFEGDGRRMLHALPPFIHPGTQPMRVTRSAARRLISMFMERGESFHSGMGGMLWVVLEFASVNNIPVEVEGSAGAAFMVRKKP